MWSEYEFSLTSLCEDVVLRAVLVTEGVSADDDRLSPARNESWNIADDDWLAEHSSIQDVSNGSIWRFPHLLQAELLDTFAVRCDGCALDTDFVLQHSLGAVNSNLVIGFVTVFYREIVVLGLQVDVGENVLMQSKTMDRLPFL